MLVEAADVDAVRANSRRLVLARGHETDQERTVRCCNGYVIVELG